MTAKAYLRFVTLTNAIEVPCDPTALRVLDAVAITPKLMKVSDVMRLSHLGSSATIHRKIADLVDDGMIILVHPDDDLRTKYVHLTDLAWGYLDSLGAALIASAGGEA